MKHPENLLKVSGAVFMLCSRHTECSCAFVMFLLVKLLLYNEKLSRWNLAWVLRLATHKAGLHLTLGVEHSFPQMRNNMLKMVKKFPNVFHLQVISSPFLCWRDKWTVNILTFTLITRSRKSHPQPQYFAFLIYTYYFDEFIVSKKKTINGAILK